MSRDIAYFKKIANELRLSVLEMVYNAKSGHIGGSFSMIEVLTALYFDEMKYDAKNPNYPKRDRFVLSKGHTAPALYAVLAQAGFYPKDWLINSFRGINSKLQGHPDMKHTPGVDMTSGSLGIGLSAACGMALGAKVQKENYYIFCMIGDGEINEGQIWEAVATAAHYKLNKLIAFVDINGLQNDNTTKIVKDMGNIPEKWRAFGWSVQEIDGHDFNQIFPAIDKAKKSKDKPSVILMHTVKGKGVSFMEDVVAWHGNCPKEEEYENAKKQLMKKFDSIA
ncbi:MAG TPA: transketolase [Clostridia bacterium]|nr:transketolase [Clostridia bacterium]